MFEAAELGQTISKQTFHERVPTLRSELLLAQRRQATSNIPVLLLFAGVDGAGKSETANLMSYWLDPRRIDTRAYGQPTDDEQQRPEYWRYWRDLPPRGHTGIFLSAWYSKPLLDHVFCRCSNNQLDIQLDRIVDFERTLVNDGVLILKFWMHLGKEAQRLRFEALEADPLQSWRVSAKDWEHWRRYEDFVASAERLVMRTSTGPAPWVIVEGADANYRSLKVGTTLLDALERRLADDEAAASLAAAAADRAAQQEANSALHARGALLGSHATVLDRLDMSNQLPKPEYRLRLQELQARLNLLHRRARETGLSTIIVFEGWDAAGKGGAIRRVIAAMDARNFQVTSIAAPTDEELAHHYLWRFWRRIPRAGRVTIYDRSWYGRVLVERVEGFATEKEWRRAYAEINDFERQLVDDQTVIVKFWLHVTPKEQEKRFEARAETPHKRWKLTEEDWRNRDKWDDYLLAVNEMVERTSTSIAPWVLVEGNDKRYARVRILEALCDALDKRLGSPAAGDTPGDTAGDAEEPVRQEQNDERQEQHA